MDFRKTIRLPDLNRNVSSHERESLVCLDKGLNEVSVILLIFVYILGNASDIIQTITVIMSEI